jgi:hypothetical protein
MANYDSNPIPPKVQNLTGKKFNRWTVLSFSRRVGKRYYWICRCECGTVKEVRSDGLISGTRKSCGCLQREWTKKMASKHLKKHGMATSDNQAPEYNIWKSMKQRCQNPRNAAYSGYGGRGIKVCARWSNSFEAFYLDMGARPSSEYTLDRIDNDGDYTPQNCRWATRTQQANNRRSNRKITFRGETHTVAEWARKLGIRQGSLLAHLDKWSVERALTDPLRKRTNNR